MVIFYNNYKIFQVKIHHLNNCNVYPLFYPTQLGNNLLENARFYTILYVFTFLNITEILQLSVILM